jgi:hypothetical protein
MTKKDLKVGMVLECESHKGKGLAMITVSKFSEPDLCISGTNDWFLLDYLDDNLTYETFKVLKVYDRAECNCDAYKLSTEDRKLLWERSTGYNGKVVCIETNGNDFVTKGKIYEFKNGHSVDDEGDRLPRYTPVKSLEDLNRIMYSDYIEVVE